MDYTNFEVWASEHSEAITLLAVVMVGAVLIIVTIRFGVFISRSILSRRRGYVSDVAIEGAPHSERKVGPGQEAAVRHPAFALAILFVVALVLMVSAWVGSWDGHSVDQSGSGGRHVAGMVTHVRDGDTIEVEGIPIRFKKLDCSERHTRKGKLATQHMRDLTTGVPLSCSLSGRKSYDRWIGECSLEDGRDLGRLMIRHGYCGRWW
ncbi:MAG: thermonuclease family protein [Roseovarius sp.]